MKQPQSLMFWQALFQLRPDYQLTAGLFLRVQAYDYRFTTVEERQQTGDWWRREYLGLFPYVAPRRP